MKKKYELSLFLFRGPSPKSPVQSYKLNARKVLTRDEKSIHKASTKIAITLASNKALLQINTMTVGPNKKKNIFVEIPL